MELLFDIAVPRPQVNAFKFRVHRVESLGKLSLDPVAFYQRWAKKVPEFPHHEVEILTPSSLFFEGRKGIHTHLSEVTNTRFVCWTERLGTLEEVEDLLSVWTVGTAVVLGGYSNGVDPLGKVYGEECGRNAAAFRKLMKERHGVQLLRIIHDPDEIPMD